MSATAGTPRARALSAALREVREATGMGVRELARKLSISHVQLSHWETGQRVPNVERVAMILGAIYVPPEDRERILALARNVQDANWLVTGMDGIPQQMAGVVECERAATAITQWIPMGVPGLLQRREYRRAIMSSGTLDQRDIELRVMLSSSRDEVITRRQDPVDFVAYISETGLYETIASPEILTDQLRYLVEMNKRPNVHIRIVPLRSGWHPGWSGPFVLYEFADISPVVHFEHHSSGAFVHTEHDVQEYRRAIEWIDRLTLTCDESSAFITEIADKMENKNEQYPVAEVLSQPDER